MNKILKFICLTMLYSNIVLGDDIPYWDYDDDYIENSMINIELYKTKENCINRYDIIYKSRYNFEVKCECIKSDNCYNKLFNSSKFNSLYLSYNNSKIYLNKLNYTNQCYNYKDYYFYNSINLYTFCSSFTILYVFLVTAVILSIIGIVNCKIKSKKYKVLDETPPNYNAIN